MCWIWWEVREEFLQDPFNDTITFILTVHKKSWCRESTDKWEETELQKSVAENAEGLTIRQVSRKPFFAGRGLSSNMAGKSNLQTRKAPEFIMI